MKAPSLFVRYWASLAMLVTLPIVVSGVLEGWAVYRAAYAAAKERQEQAAKQAALIVEQFVAPPIDRLVIAAAIPWGYSTARDEFRSEMMRIGRQFPLIERVQRIDRDARIVDSYSKNGKARDLAAAELEQMARHVARGDAGTDEVTPITLDSAGTWSVIVPVRHDQGFLVADLRIDTIGDAIARTPDWGSNRMFLVDRTGAVLLADKDISLPPGLKVATLPGWNAIPGLDRIFAGGGGSAGDLGEISAQVTTDPKQGHEWFASYRHVRPVGWTVFALSPSAELRAEIVSAVGRTAVIAVSANIVALLLALAWARQMSRPLESLAEASHRVAQGDLTAQAAIFSNDDIGRVSRQFNSMVDQLRVSYTDLEARVAEKTAELEKANRHKSEFLAQMSHELRTPLNAVIGFSDALKAQYFGELNEKQLEYVRDIHASGQHLLSLINDLLDLAKIEAGRMDIAVGSVDVKRVVDGALALVRGRAETRGIALAASFDPDVTTWQADERKLKQILLNLLSNAVKFTPDGGAVTITVARAPAPQAQGSVLKFAISDTGIGIPPDQVSKLFTDFGQIEQGAAGTREGTGLGLALSRRLVELHGGRIWAESEPGRGSTFHFTLPERK